MAEIILTAEMIELLIAAEKQQLQEKFDADVAALEQKYKSAKLKLKPSPIVKYTDEDKATVIKMYKAGARAKKISEALGRKSSSVSAYISKLKKDKVIK